MFRAPAPPSPLVFAAQNGIISAFDRASGAPAWLFRTPGAADTSRDHVTRIVSDEHRLFAVSARREEGGVFSSTTGRAELFCIDYRTGQLVWQQAVSVGVKVAYFTATLMLDGGQVFLVHGSLLAAFAADTGQVLWTRVVEGHSRAINPTPVALCVAGQSMQGDAT